LENEESLFYSLCKQGGLIKANSGNNSSSSSIVQEV
jgi:hypothetical protein